MLVRWTMEMQALEQKMSSLTTTRVRKTRMSLVSMAQQWRERVLTDAAMHIMYSTSM